jgi:diguanylate cyclase (GGDEF)-like protein
MVKQRVTLDRKLRRDKSFDAASRDQLTGLMGYQQLQVVLKDEIERSIVEQHPMALALFSIDKLKEFGDTYGQQFCETIVRELGHKLGMSIRGTDSAGRFSSEEFALILTKTDPDLIITTADRIRKRLMEIVIRTPVDTEIKPTLSCGVAMCNELNATPDLLIKVTSKALTNARQNGNMVVVFDGSQ